MITKQGVAWTCGFGCLAGSFLNVILDPIAELVIAEMITALVIFIVAALLEVAAAIDGLGVTKINFDAEVKIEKQEDHGA